MDSSTMTDICPVSVFLLVTEKRKWAEEDYDFLPDESRTEDTLRSLHHTSWYLYSLFCLLQTAAHFILLQVNTELWLFSVSAQNNSKCFKSLLLNATWTGRLLLLLLLTMGKKLNVFMEKEKGDVKEEMIDFMLPLDDSYYNCTPE